MKRQRVIDAGEEFLRVQVCGICDDPISLFIRSDIPTIVTHAEDVFGQNLFRYVTFSLSLAHCHSTYSEIRVASASFRPSVKRFNTSSATRGGMMQSLRIFCWRLAFALPDPTRARILLPDFFFTPDLWPNSGPVHCIGKVVANSAAI